MFKNIKKIHILGVAGKMTAPLAVELKRLGYEVSGSDQEKIYPPVSDILKQANIRYNQDDWEDCDLVIVGSSYKSFNRTKSEYEKATKKGIKVISATEFVASQVLKKKSVLVAGTYGKTTVTAMVAWIMMEWDRGISFMVGGDVEKMPSLRMGQSDWSVAEADESINGLDQKAKFLYYPVSYLILTAADWEHKEAYRTEAENFKAFNKLVNRVNEGGVLVVNYENIKAQKAVVGAKCRIVGYGKGGDYSISNIKWMDGKMSFEIAGPNCSWQINSKMIGKHNRNNMAAAVALCDQIGIPKNIIEKRLSEFEGVKRRLQKLAEYDRKLIFDDFGQSADRIKAALEAIKESFPAFKIKVFYEAHASYLLDKKSLIGMRKSFELASEVVLAKIPYKKTIGKQDRTTARDFRNVIGEKLQYLPIYDQIEKYYQENLKPGDILVHFSSGGLEGSECLDNIVKNLRKENRS